MHSRLIMIAAIAAVSATPGAAGPQRVTAQNASEASNRPAQGLLAQADIRTPVPQAEVRAETAAEVQPPVKRPRVGRVSSCRCGSQLPEQP